MSTTRGFRTRKSCGNSVLNDPVPHIPWKWARQAKVDLAKLAMRASERVRRAVDRAWSTGQGDLRRLRGLKARKYRLKVGQWRVILEFKERETQVLRVLHRREAYRKSARIRQPVPEMKEPIGGDTVETPECSQTDSTAPSLKVLHALDCDGALQ